MTSFSVGPPTHQLRFTIQDEYLQVGVALHRLTLRVSVHGAWLDPSDQQASAAVLVQGTVDGGFPRRYMSLIPAHVINVRSYPINDVLSIQLSDDQLLQLEVDRGSNGVDLQLDLAATYLRLPPSMHPTYDTQIVHHITAGRWLELLDNAGMLVGITVRVPSPLTDTTAGRRVLGDDGPSMMRAGERLREARTALRDGDWPMCVRLCRHVLDNIRLLDSPESADNVRKTAPASRTESQRWSALFHDLYSLASAASHDDGVTADFAWSREDAQAVLAATAGLLARVPTVRA